MGKATTGEDGVVVVAPAELDLVSAERFAGSLLSIDASVPVTVDFSGVEFMDSSGLRALVQAAERHVRAGTPFHVTQARPSVRRLFEITALTHLLEN